MDGTGRARRRSRLPAVARRGALIAVLTVIGTGSGASWAEWLIGAKAGPMRVEFDDASVDSDPLNAGVLAGYAFDELLPGLAAELELTRSVSSGTVVGSDLDVDSNGLYAAYRTAGRFYVKGRLGLMAASLDGELAEDENGETYGLGAGWRLPRGALELEYTSIDDDVAFVSLGFVYRLSR